jgi:membrane-bound lytic murein transglycosylase D
MGEVNVRNAEAIKGTGDPEYDAGDETGQKASTKEVNPPIPPEEKISPLLSRDYLGQFDIPIVFNEAVDYFIRYFTVQKRKVFVNWLKRSKRYAPTIRGILRQEGLPEDLVYLAMIESGFNPKAYSPMKACGPWQFIYETGERYGLRVNYWVDERRDPQKSTVAAARYLRDLFNQFGCWYLAAAGYNAGERRIERAIIKHETNDFWELSKYNTLPRETREYIPQLIAAAIIAKDPERFGLRNIPFDAPIPSTIHRVPGGTPLSLVARAAGFDLPSLHSLNPEILRGITPPGAGSYALRLPARVDGEEFRVRLRAELQDGSRVQGVTAHVAKRKDSISRITRQYGVSPGDLMLVNACGGDFSIRTGSVVYIPRFERDGERKAMEQAQGTQNFEKDEKGKASRPPTVTEKTDDNAKRYHVVKRGEKVPDIPRRYGVETGVVKQINNPRGNKIRPKTRILLASGPRVSSSTGKDGAEEAGTQSRVFHVVKKGENLADIAEKYGTNVANLRKVNKLKKDRITPNMKLEVAARNKTQLAESKPDRSRSGRSRTNPARTVQARPAKLYHVVKNGENLSDISEKYSLNVASLKKMNGLKKDGVRPGMRLRVASR